MAVSDQTGDVVACGESGNRDYKECFTFNGISWNPLPPLHEDHKPYAYQTKSYFMKNGLWVGGRVGLGGGMVNELFNSEGQWTTLPVDSPYDITYPHPCSVPLNSTHIFFCGGTHIDYLLDTWILDLENLEWIPSTPMLTPRHYHGCILTENGEVIIAGGAGGESSVHTFNPFTMEWRESVNLPSDVNTWKPILLSWRGNVILIESGSDTIWLMEEDQGWKLMNASMGTSYDGYYDNAVVVLDSLRAGCP